RANKDGGAAMAEPNVVMGSRMIGDITLGDLRVPRLGFGAMRITGEDIWGDPPDPAAARRLLQRVVELGVRFIDTADAYGPDVSERLIAEALHPYPAGLVIGTKGGIVRPDRATWSPDGRPAHLREACEGSLRRLRLERIDLYQLHAVDPRVPLEDSVGELARLQGEGKIRHVGLSNVSVDELERARRLVKVVSVQNRYNVADRSSKDVLAVCERDGLAFIPWSPLVQGERDRGSPQRAALESWARKRDLSLHQAALAWLLNKSPVMLPIPGTSKVPHLESNLAAALAARGLRRDLSAVS
ncbi:MAG: Aldo-keto reductase, partial [Steroidobacteraceae bacterium]|nr:Aldo-keto reductase [Steroidobacteraceae bacterium]